MPFEYLYRGMITVKMDAFALGVVIGELVTGRAPQDVREIAAAAAYGEMGDEETPRSFSSSGAGGAGGAAGDDEDSVTRHVTVWGLLRDKRMVAPAPPPSTEDRNPGSGRPPGFERNLLGEPWEKSGRLEELAYVAQQLLVDDRRQRRTVKDGAYAVAQRVTGWPAAAAAAAAAAGGGGAAIAHADGALADLT